MTTPATPQPGTPSLDRVLDALDRSGYACKRQSRADEWMAQCPVHDDNEPSLAIRWQDEVRGGRTLLHCHACKASAAEIAEALGLGLQDLFDAPWEAPERTLRRSGPSAAQRRSAARRGNSGRAPKVKLTKPAPAPEHLWREVERYAYCDAEGHKVQEVVRRHCECTGSVHKDFRQTYFERGRMRHRKPQGFVPVLYRSERLAHAAPAETVWLVEGEKDVHAAEAHHLLATTNPGGGNNFPDELIDTLSGRTVHLVLDQDATGWRRGLHLYPLLKEAGCRVRMFVPATREDKSDLSDHFAAGWGIDDLCECTVPELEVWSAVADAKAEAATCTKAVEEAKALLEHDLGEDAGTWAQQAEISLDKLTAHANQVCARAIGVGTPWTGEAMTAVETMLESARTAVTQIQLATGKVAPVAPAPAPDPAPATSTDDSRSNDSTALHGPVFRIVEGQIGMFEPARTPPAVAAAGDKTAASSSKDGANDTADNNSTPDDSGAATKPDQPKFKRLLGMVVQIVRREFHEDLPDGEDDVDPSLCMGRSPSSDLAITPLRRLASLVMEYCDPMSGELLRIRVRADQWRDHSWLESLPVADYDHRRAGLDVLQRAIVAISDDVRDIVVHKATGWRTDPEHGEMFVHARGAISASGHVDVPVNLDKDLRRFDLPDPTTDPAQLRKAWQECSQIMMRRLPQRVAAPLLGGVWRSAMGHNPWVMALIGSPGSFKTSVASKAMHHWGERWSHSRAATSMSGNGDTLNALRLKLHQAKDALYWMDDFAPTKSWLEAQKLLEETVRLVHNQEGRGRLERDAISMRDGTRPQASGLCTSEVMPRAGSASQRMLVIPLDKSDIDTKLLFPLDDADSRHGRALLMASFIQWLAADSVRRTHTYRGQAAGIAEECSEHGVRQGQAVASMWEGWLAMTDFLLERGAISGDEHAQARDEAHAGLLAANKAAVDPDLPRTTGARVRELLGYALQQGLAYVEDARTGEAPPWPLAAALGWRRVPGWDDNPRLERPGIRFGWVMHDPGPRERGRVLMVDSSQLEAVLKAAGSTQTERLEIDRTTALRALHEEGILLADTSEGRTRYTVKCRIPAEGRTIRLACLHLDRLIDHTPDDGDDEDPAGPEAPDVDGDDGGAGGRDQGPDAPGSAGAASELPMEAPAVEETVAPLLVDDQVGAAESEAGEWGAGSEDGGVQRARAVSATANNVQRDCHREEPEDPMELHQRADDPQTCEPTSCRVCGHPCSVTYGGVPLHVICVPQYQAMPDPDAPSTEVADEMLPVEEPDSAAEDRSERPAMLEPSAAQQQAVEALAGAGHGIAAAVFDVDCVWFGEDGCLKMPRVRHLGDIMELAVRMGLGAKVGVFHRAEPGQVWITNDLAARMGINVEVVAAGKLMDQDKPAADASRDAEGLLAAERDGYEFGGFNGGLRRWTRAVTPVGKRVMLVLMAGVADMQQWGDADMTHEQLARRLHRFATATGQPFKFAPQPTGLDLMIGLRKNAEEEFAPVDLVEDDPQKDVRNLETDNLWFRTPTSEERQHEWVHAYDRNGSYLGAIAGLSMGVGNPTELRGDITFDRKLPGLWHLREIPDSGDWRMPNPLDPQGRWVGHAAWVTTPSLEFAHELGIEPEIDRALVWRQHSRMMVPWQSRLKEAREKLDTDDVDDIAARNVVKATYTRTIGYIQSHELMGPRCDRDGKLVRAARAGYAPHRSHHIIARARMSILRQIHKIGRDTDRWPIGVTTDLVLYTCDEADPVKAWPGDPAKLGRRLGEFKPESSVRLEDVPELLEGRGLRSEAQVKARMMEGSR